MNLKEISFTDRHIGISTEHQKEMLSEIGLSSLQNLISEVIPDKILLQKDLDLPPALSEEVALDELKQVSEQNKNVINFVGQGYYGTITPAVILRNMFENPGWYTAYTPYQAEISQGRLESLLNYQTLIASLTGLAIANASLLDESTAVAEAMGMAVNYFQQQTPRHHVLYDPNLFNQTVAVIKTRAKALKLNLDVFNNLDQLNSSVAALIIQTPNKYGIMENFSLVISEAKKHGIMIIIATDLMALTIIKSPVEWGVDIACGSAQRFGVPLGYGGPHAAFLATHDAFKRLLPGRIIGVSQDAQGNPALRMALQTREQHIRREKATSNICTAQALLANMAAMYAIYHGRNGLIHIAQSIHLKAQALAKFLKSLGLTVVSQNNFFDTVCVQCSEAEFLEFQNLCSKNNINLMFHQDHKISISVDESTTLTQLKKLAQVCSILKNNSNEIFSETNDGIIIHPDLLRKIPCLTQPIFTENYSETKMLRYLKYLENKDISLTNSMISLGSCTMKLNATSEMIPLSWPAFNAIHPFAPQAQVPGYHLILKELSQYLCTITGFSGCSLQPNSGAQGEYAGLLCLKKYFEAQGQHQRNIILIPLSAHGTNPASASVAGLKVQVVSCNESGYINIEDLKMKAEQHKNNLVGMMITYPSTYGIFDEEIKEICQIVHDNGGLVYLDGANMNAQVGLTSPAMVGADVCHLNLHKTFAIPHGGGGPGMGPICVRDFLIPYLPQHFLFGNNDYAVSAAPYGSASILIISYLYIKLLGGAGLKRATSIAILNANYMQKILKQKFDIHYTNKNGYCAHEFILDCRSFKKTAEIEVEDIAKRLMDYGFHAPTLSFPVPGTLMIEPTESEDKAELDRFCLALLQIHSEIKNIENGVWDKKDNPLKNAPHSQAVVCGDEWNHGYSRTTAAFPMEHLKKNKVWPTVGRVNNAYGDRNLICTCAPIENYM